MQRQKFNLRTLLGLLFVAGSLFLPLTSQANVSDFTLFTLVSQRNDATQQGQKICTYESILNHTRVELTIPYICWTQAFQNRRDGQFYRDTY